MPFTQAVLDEVYARANQLWDIAWRDPERPPRAYYQPDGMLLLREGDNGTDVTECFELSFDAEKQTWTLVALKRVRWTHMATEVGWVAERVTSDPAAPYVQVYNKGDKLVMMFPKIGVENMR